MSPTAAEAAREWLKSNGVLGTGVPWSTLLAELTALLESREAAARAEGMEQAAAVIRAAREWRRSRRTGAEDWPASVDLAAAIDVLDADREEK